MKRPAVLLCAILAMIASILTLNTPAASAAPTAPTAAPRKAVPDPSHPGTWSTLNCPGVNPIHTGTLPSGNQLWVAGSGYNRKTFEANTANPALKLYKAWIYEPDSGQCPREIPLPQDKDLFCAGMTSLPDGRLLFFGGTGGYGAVGSSIGTPDYYKGIRDAYVFNEATESFTQVADMSVGRWYGQGPVDSAGRPMVYSGLDENAQFTNKVERFNPDTGTWTSFPATTGALPMYAGNVMLPNGNFAYTGTYFGVANGQSPKVFNPATSATVAAIPGLLTPTCRDQGITLRRDNQAAVIGGGCPGSATGNTSLLNLSAPTSFTNGPYLGYAAQHLCGAVLPDRSYFVSGGSVGNITPRYEARRLALGATSWQTLAAPTVPRQYHSTCMVTPSGKVSTMGTNYNDGSVETRIETYTPWYAQGQGLVRPGFLTLSASAAPVGARITASNDYSSVTSVTLTKLPTSTHSSDPNQITFTVPNDWKTFGAVSFQLPGATTTPPGMYWVSLLDWRGVPTTTKLLRILPAGKAIVRASIHVGIGGGSAAACCCC